MTHNIPSKRKQDSAHGSWKSIAVLLVMTAWGCRSAPSQAGPKMSAASNAVATQRPEQQPAPAAVPIQAVPAQTSTDNQGWNIYTSPSGSYKLSYPAAGEVARSEPSTLEISFVQKFETGRDVLTFQVVEHENPDGAKVEDWVLQQWNDGDAIKEQGKSELAGREAYRLKIFESDQYSIHIYTASGKLIYEITYVDPQSIGELPPEIQKHWAEIFAKMAASFSLQQH